MKARMLSVTLVVSLLLAVTTRAAAAKGGVVPDVLFQQASTAGSARVIVRLNAPFSPDAAMRSPAHAAVQRQDIAAVRSALKAQLAAARHTIVREYDSLPFLAVEAGPDALALLEALTGLVVSVEEDAIRRPHLAQSVPLVQAPQAWTAGFDGTGTIVAVLDTGVEKTHPFLSGKVIAEACFSSNTSNAGHTVTSLCPGGVTSSTAPGSGVNCSAAVVSCDHGTHVAGIVAGGATGASGAGVAPGASLMSIQVFSRFPAAHPSCGGAACALSFASDEIAALNHVFNQRNAFPGKVIASVNMSLGGGAFTAPCTTDPLVTPIAQLRTVGIATIVASGNNGFTDAISSPACAPGAISVGSTGDGSLSGAPLDEVSSFSNMASFVSLLAPGQWIRSSVPTTTDATGFANFAGTSMATPHVAGAFAILREANSTASVDTLLQALQSTGQPITDTRPVCASCVSTGVTSPRLEVEAALEVVGVPDVAVTAAGTVASVAAGQAIVVSSTVRNLGPAAVGAFTVGYFLSANTAFDDGVDVFLGGRTVTSLAAGAANSAPKTVTVPAGTIPGTYRIIVVADSGAVLAESNESNNVRATSALTVVGPDVTVTAASTAATAAPGQAIVVNGIVKNVGTAAAGSFVVRYFLSTDGVLDAGDVLLGGRTVTSLAAGAENTAPKTVTIPAGTTPRRYRLVVVADATNALGESNESNNARATASFMVGPEVTVTAATTVSAASPGAAIVIDSTITNLGSAAGSFIVRYFLSADAVVDAGDVLVGGRTVTSLAPGAENTAPKTVTIPAGTAPGSYRLLVVADATNTLAESNEGNNVRATPAIGVGPDVTITTATTVATASPGAAIVVNGVVTNLGSAAGTFVVHYYLSENAVFDGLDVRVGGRTVTSLAAGAQNTTPKTVTIPVGTVPATYRIFVIADATGVLSEVSETNNVLATAAITIGP